MTQNYSAYLYPSCEILVNGQKRKLYGKNKNKVYLNNGDEFQLKVYNPLSARVGFQLKMNGSENDNAMLIVNPGQTAIIERFIGTQRKLKFSTYLYDKNNPQSKKAIKDNGKLEVKFWSENTVQPQPYVEPWVIPVPQPQPWILPVPVPQPYPVYPITPPLPNPPSWPVYICGSSNGDYSNLSSAGSATSENLKASNFSSNSSNIDLNGKVDISGDLNVGKDFMYARSLDSKGSIHKSSVINNLGEGRIELGETGRIEKGNYSNQYFRSTEFKAGYVIKTYIFKLLPFSEKGKEPFIASSGSQNNPYIIPNNTNTYSTRSDYREYCPNKRCNYRIRKGSWAFCPLCGEKLD